MVIVAQFAPATHVQQRGAGNSGVSIRDATRGKFAAGPAWVADKTPSHNGYEIQIITGHDNEKYPTGSIYLFEAARKGVQNENDWNKMEIRSRDNLITVLVNGQKVAEHAGDPARPKSGPIGLQLHDANSVVMFRNIRINEIK